MNFLIFVFSSLILAKSPTTAQIALTNTLLQLKTESTIVVVGKNVAYTWNTTNGGVNYF